MAASEEIRMAMNSEAVSLGYSSLKKEQEDVTVRRKFLTGENIDEFDEFPAIRQYFPYQNFPFS